MAVGQTCNLVGYCSPFREQNDTRAVNRTCERFCACESHTCLSHYTDPPSQQNIIGTIELYTKEINLTFKIVYSTGLGGSQKNTETENRHKKT